MNRTHLILAGSLAMFQVATAQLSGVVVDGKKVGIDGVFIELKNKGLTTLTAGGGLFSFPVSAVLPSSKSNSGFQILSQFGLVELNMKQPTPVSITVYDMLNRSETILDQVVHGAQSFDILKMSQKMHQPGVYFAQMTVGDQTYSLRILKIQNAQRSIVQEMKAGARLNAVAIDSIIASKSGYKTKSFPVTAYTLVLPNLALTMLQTITFNTIPAKIFGDSSFKLAATASSGMKTSYASMTSKVCSIIDTTTLRILSAGTCTVNAYQTGDSIYSAATSVTQSFNIAKAPQTITFPAIGTKYLGDADFEVMATTSSKMLPNITVSTTSVCDFVGPFLRILSAGTCTLTASHPGTNNYEAATSVTQSFTVSKGVQTINFGAMATKYMGDSAITINATSNVKLPLTFVSSTPANCTIRNGTAVTILALGTCTITASQAGNSSYTAATSVTQSFSIASPLADPCGVTTPGFQNWFTQGCYEKIFARRKESKCVADGNGIYTYDNFMIAASHWPKFGNEGDLVTQKKDVAAFFAHVNQETGGGNPDSSFALCWVYERAAMPNKNLSTYNQASSTSSPYQPVSGQFYFGRGPFQMSWPANYGWFSEAVLGNKDILLNRPDSLAKNGVIAFKSALWFWNQKQDDWLSPIPPTLHDVIVKNSAYQTWTGFGATTKVINGALECNTGNQSMMTRGRYYGAYQKLLKIPDASQDKTNLYCNTSGSYTF